MPSVFTHYLVARESVKEAELVESELLPLYFYGAYGPDFCFFYKFLDPKQNLGSYIHRQGGYQSFRVLQALSAKSPAVRAYALGFITHYAADVVFHPFVYKVAKKSLLKHSRVENALDGFLKRTMGEENDPYLPYFRKKLSEKEKDELFFAYAAIALKNNFPPLEKSGFRRAISLFNAYVPMPNAFFRGEKDWGDTFVGEGEREQALAVELFLKAVDLSKSLFAEFLSCAENRTPLPRSSFGKNFLSGV